MTDVLVAALVAAVVSVIITQLMKPKAIDALDKTIDVASALIILYEGTSGAASAKVFPYRLQAKKKWDVEWIILDPAGLSASKDVKIHWTDEDPLESEVKGKKRIKSKVKNYSGTYPYEVRLDGVALADPDLEIVM
jgi:hypothetical protein